MINKIAILLVCSPKSFKSSSENIGNLLLNYFAEQGYLIESENIGIALRKGEVDELISKVNNSEITIISTPLYVDSIPAPLINFLEHYKNNNHKKDKKLITIVNSGFPESSQNDTAIEVIRLFAMQNGFLWAGGFAIGCGGAFGKMDLRKAKMARHISESFYEAALHLSKGNHIPEYVFEKAAKPIMPKSFYVFSGQLGWYLQSIKNRTLFKLNARPYCQ